MSYSFDFRADTKLEATAEIREEFDAVMAYQPTHEKDKEAAIVAGQALVRCLTDPGPEQEIHVHMNGYLSWQNDPKEFVSANLNIRVEIKDKA